MIYLRCTLSFFAKCRLSVTKISDECPLNSLTISKVNP